MLLTAANTVAAQSAFAQNTRGAKRIPFSLAPKHARRDGDEQ